MSATYPSMSSLSLVGVCEVCEFGEEVVQADGAVPDVVSRPHVDGVALDFLGAAHEDEVVLGQLGLADLLVELLVAQIAVGIVAGIVDALSHLLHIVVVVFCDGAHDGAMDHHRAA